MRTLELLLTHSLYNFIFGVWLCALCAIFMSVCCVFGHRDNGEPFELSYKYPNIYDSTMTSIFQFVPNSAHHSQ